MRSYEVKCDQVHSIGPDETGLYDALGSEKHWKWCIYWYECGSWEGSGQLVACDDNDDLWSGSLGHCSCYGPGDGGVTRDGPLSKHLASANALDSYDHGITAKIIELYGTPPSSAQQPDCHP